MDTPETSAPPGLDEAAAPPAAWAGILPTFRERFSGWHLGMGTPDVLAGLLRGLAALGASEPGCHDTARAMGLWGAQAYPLSASLAASMPPDAVADHPALHALLARLADTPPPEQADREAAATWHTLVRGNDHELTLRFLTLTLRDPLRWPAWLRHCWQDLLFLNRPDLAEAALDMVPWDAPSLPLKARLTAELAFHSQPPDKALPLVAALDPAQWGLWRIQAGSELLLRLGEAERGRDLLATLWRAIPWHVNLTLKLHALYAQPIRETNDEETSSVAVLLYSWNKADLLASTLESLAASQLGQARIFVLDNGSADHTPQVLEQARNLFHRPSGGPALHVTTLPVNVGAPAARNWLLSLPEVRPMTWAAFLDDDVILPQDWLMKLLGAAREHGGADRIGAVGCRITSATAPHGLQSADYNLFPRPPKAPEPGALPNRVAIFDNCTGSPDTGLFTYVRPCLSVSGCCHLVSMAAIARAGGFDLRFTPSQFDDLDRDLRSALAGMPALYAGNLAVRHVQHSSLAKAQTLRQTGHVMGNKLKLDTKHSDEELAGLARDTSRMLWDDLAAKHDTLVDRLGRNA
ncbi:glycosyltransferase [Pseudodesulfovibrio sp. F-1]|uniref:Glycosyltransferase n=1 Tax=Pseudodesulfovibrio alkaliphilus TaxID=2661613 RepID=A0A7K1KJT8_9BACT|nr:glycosyltransferase [Pseudodesulfovibrio alkaliphilus]MUM76290.1 glycosyltransferase [Pseudodesulfovibrio alkaliphilus]